MKKIIHCYVFSFVCFSAYAGDSIDLQWSVCDKSPEMVLRKIGESDAKDKLVSVSYYDTDLGAYIQDGVTFRGKDKKGQEESSIKIRFSKPEDVSGASCEWDQYGQEKKYTCEVVGNLKEVSVNWSREQLDFLNKFYSKANVKLLKSYGPFENRKWKFKYNDTKASFDVVDTKEAGPLMEFSMKVSLDDSEKIYAQFSKFLVKNGVQICARQDSKTMRLFRALGLVK